MAENKTKGAAPVSASNDRQTLIHIHSVEDGKTPAPEKLHFGELAVNYKTNNEFISFKNQEGKIVKVLPESKVVKKDGAETITGKKTFSNGLAITNCDQNPNLGFVLGIDAFSDGGTVKWSNTKDLSVGSASKATKADSITTVNGDTDADRPVFFGLNGNTSKLAYSSDFQYNPANKGTLSVNNLFSNGISKQGKLFSNVAQFNSRTTVDQIVIKTSIPFISGNSMPLVHLKGYAYGEASPIEITIAFYIYDGYFCAQGATSTCPWDPTIYLFPYTKGGSKYVAIGLEKSIYFARFQVDMLDIWTDSERNSYAEGWTVESRTSKSGVETIIPSTETEPLRKTVPYKPIANDITGSASYATSAGTASHASDLLEGSVKWKVNYSGANVNDGTYLAVMQKSGNSGEFRTAERSSINVGSADKAKTVTIVEGTVNNDRNLWFNASSTNTAISGNVQPAAATSLTYNPSTKKLKINGNNAIVEGDSRLTDARTAANSSVSKSGETLTVTINGVTKSLTNTDTDTKVTSVGNHYKPTSGTSTGTGSVTTGNGATVVTSISKDAAGHITEVGLGKLSIPQIPGISVSDSGSGNAVTDVTASGHTVTLTRGTFAEKAFKTVNGDSGTATAETSSDTLTITGGAKIGTVATDTSGADKITINHDAIALSKPSATSGGVLNHGGTFTVVSDITGDDYGHVESMARKTFTLPAQYIHPSTSRTDTKSSATAIHEGTVTMIDSIESDTEGHITKVNTKTITMPSVPDVAVSTTGSGFVTGVVSDGHGIKVKERAITAEDITSGVFNIERIPKAALERCTVVADDTARLKLTKDTVQNGDTVKVTETKKMYFVKDDEKLSSEAGYEEYLTSTDWSVVTNKPSYFKYVASDNGTATADTTDDTISLVGDGTWVETLGITEPDKITISHKTVTRSNSTTSASPKHGGTVTVVDSVSSDTRGHVTGVNTKTITLPTAYTHPSKPTEGLSDAGSTGTTAGQKTFVMNVNIDSKGHVGSVDKGTIPNEIKVGTAAPSSSIVETIYVDEDDNSTDVELATKAEIQALTTRVTELEAQVKELISTLNTALASIERIRNNISILLYHG